MLEILLKFKNTELKTIKTDKEEITIGRNTANDIHIDNLGVSKQHARIVKHKDAYLIEDFNSTNGTFINGQKVAKAELKDNDVVGIGKHSLVIFYKKQTSANPNQDFGDRTVVVKK